MSVSMDKMPVRTSFVAKGLGPRPATYPWTPRNPALRLRNGIFGLCVLTLVTLPTGCSPEESSGGQGPPLVDAVSKKSSKRSGGPPKEGQVSARQTPHDHVSGVVLGPRGMPMAAVRVTLYKRLRQWPRRDRVELDSVRTGTKGRFVFSTSRGRGMEVEAKARRCATLVRTAPPPGLGTLILQFSRGFRVAGSVVLPTGRPARNCVVYLEPGSRSQMRAVQTNTDRDGRFEFLGVPADNLRVSARHDLFQPATDVVTIGRPTALRFERPEVGLSGRVMSGDDPVADCEVLVSPRTTSGVFCVPFAAVTDRDGQYRIRGLGEGSYNIELRHDKYSSAQRTLSLHESRTGLELELASRVKVKGQLTGAKNIANTQLSIVSFYGETATTRVRADGSFEFAEEFSSGMATIELEAGQFSFKVSQSRWVRRALIEDGDDFELEIQPASEVKGVVLGHDGKPLAGVAVLAALKIIEDPLNFFTDQSFLVTRQRVFAVTDNAGRYMINGLEPGEVTLSFQKARFGSCTKVAIVKFALKGPDASEPPVKLLAPGTISGRVTRGGRPVPGALVSVGKGLARSFTGPDGRYLLRDLPAGNHLVRVKFRTLKIAHSDKPIALMAGQEVSGVAIALRMGRRIRGKVVDSEEIPLANMIVEGQAGTTTKTDEAGRFELDVPLGRTMLHVRMSQFDPSFERVPVGRDVEELTVQIRQAPRAAVRALVKALPKETPVVEMILRLDTDSQQVQFKSLSPGYSWTESMRAILNLQKLNEHHLRGHVERWIETADGTLDLRNLPAGAYELTLHAKGYQPFVKKVTMFNGKPIDLGVVKLEQGFTVEGVVLSPSGQPVPGARIVLGRESDLTLSGARTWYVADRRGRFRVEGVGLKLHNLYVAAKGYATQHHELDLAKDILRDKGNPVQVKMQPGARIRVVLIGMDGNPVPFKMVQLNRGFQWLNQAETDDQGVAWFYNVSKGSYHLGLQGKLRSLTNQVVRDTSGARVYSVKIRDVRDRKGKRQRRR